jgi:ABC-type dipeptide/oligopeptide/nickel transport system permease component
MLLGIAICFLAIVGLPDAAYQRAGPYANEATLERLRSELALDRSPPARFAIYWRRLWTGELRSMYTQEPLRDVFPEKLTHTMKVLAAGVAALAALTAGWMLAYRAFPRLRHVIGIAIGATASVPVFLSATLLMYAATVVGAPGWLAAGVSLALFPSILVATNLEQRWAAATHAKYRVVERHYRISRFASFRRLIREFAPASVLIGNAIAFYLVAGVSIVELVFGIPGLGRWMLDALLRVDLPVIFLTGVAASASASLVLFVANLISLWADPRHEPRLVAS